MSNDNRRLLDTKTFGSSLEQRRALAEFLPWLKRYYSNVVVTIEIVPLPNDQGTTINVWEGK